jgi:glycosyltransferase involved in cell wall biosynthesis
VNAASPTRQITLIGHAAGATLNFRAPLIADLVAAGWRVEVLAPDWTPDQRQRLRALGAQARTFPLSRTGLNPLQDLRSLWVLYRHLRDSRPDAVLTYAAKTNVWGMLAAAWAGVPRRVAMVEGMGFAFTERQDGRTSKQRMVGAVLSVLYRVAFRLAHRVIVLNPDDARDLQRRCGLAWQKTTLLGGIGVPLSDWPFCPPHTTPITFTLVARLLREKGVLEFVQAARLIKERHPSTRFLLLGALDDNPGSLREANLQPWVQAGIIEWPGQVDVKPWLAQTSVFVLPSYYREGVPRSTQEAMAMGRAVITTDAPGCRETVVDGVNGFLVPPRDVPALAAAMQRFIDEPALIARMGAESRRLAEERFDVRRANAIIMDSLLVG